ncbi:hypothetical protein U9M48_001556 [Paspalum notatum var. saurae]|uniref:Uncharacterized protein n=1 Tax=Paspalum notatum var. saurae TaxID=547442 RepID=A0AAQ3PP11_PASNO
MKSDLLNNKTIGALWWSYQQLDEHVKQCFTFCSIFPRRYELQRDELVHMWMAEGFVKVTDATRDMEDETGFGKPCYKIHDLLHELAGRAAGNDYFRIERGMVGHVPQDVRHIFIMSYDQRLFEEEILHLKSLRTVITLGMLSEDLCRLLQSLKKLRVVHVKLEREYSLTGYLSQKKFIADRDVHYFKDNEIANLVNLRYIKTHGEFLYPDIGRLTSLRTLSVFRVSKIRGYEIQQLEHLDNLHGTLTIKGLENVSGNEEARQAKIYKKVHVTGLELIWYGDNESSKKQEDVLEALRPPFLITSLKISGYDGSTYPSWCSGEKGALKNLQDLQFVGCHAPPKIGESFMYLRTLVISNCRWCSVPENIECLTWLEKLTIDSCENMESLPRLPLSLREIKIHIWYGSSLGENMESLSSLEELTVDRCYNTASLPRLPLSLVKLTVEFWNGSALAENMESLSSLQKLDLTRCPNILSLPRLPSSLKELRISECDKFLIQTCKTEGNPNWEKIAHIENKLILEM